MAVDKLGNTSVFCLTSDFMIYGLSTAIRASLTVSGTSLVLCLCKAVRRLWPAWRSQSSSWFTPCVNNRRPRFFSKHFVSSLTLTYLPYCPSLIRPSNWPIAGLKASSLRIFPILTFFFIAFWSVISLLAFLCYMSFLGNFLVGVFMWLQQPLTQVAVRWTNKLRCQWLVPDLTGYI